MAGATLDTPMQPQGKPWVVAAAPKGCRAGSCEAREEDLDGFLRFYNDERSHQGYRTRGRTPW